MRRRSGSARRLVVALSSVVILLVAGPASAFPGTSDTFSRPDGSLGSTSTGLPWSVTNSTWGVRSAQARVLTQQYANTLAYATVNIGVSSGFTVSADIRLSPTYRRANAGLTLLFVSHANNIFCKIEVTSGNTNGLMSIGRRLNSTTTAQLAYRRNVGLVNGGTYRVTCGRSGNVVRMTARGYSLSYTLSSADLAAFGSGTRVGLRSHVAWDEDDRGSSYDNFLVTSP